MKRHIPGLQREGRNGDDILEGIFLVRVDRAFYRWHPQRPFFVLRFVVLEPPQYRDHSLTGRLYCSPKAIWKLNCSCVISVMTQTCLEGMKLMRKPWSACEESFGHLEPSSMGALS